MDLFASNFITDPYRNIINPSNNIPSFVNPNKSTTNILNIAAQVAPPRKVVPKPLPPPPPKVRRTTRQNSNPRLDTQVQPTRWAKLYIGNNQTPINISESAILPKADYKGPDLVLDGYISNLILAKGEGSNQKYHIFKSKDDTINLMKTIEEYDNFVIERPKYIKIIKSNGKINYYIETKPNNAELYIIIYKDNDNNFEIPLGTPTPKEMQLIMNFEGISSFSTNSEKSNIFLIFILIIIIIIYVHLSRRNQKNNNLSSTYELT